MARTIECKTEKSICIDEYIEYIDSNVDLTDLDSIAESAPILQALSNNRNLVIDIFNRNIENYLSGDRMKLYSPQSFIIGSKRAPQRSFFVRGNIWTPVSGSANLKALEERVFSYNIAHDHNFHFLTVGYWGCGYETRIYEYDNVNVQGYIGEKVPLTFLEQTRLPVGKLMQYRPGVDVHLQSPPQELSISLNLMVIDPVLQAQEQYFFDLDTKKIVGYPYNASVFKRISLIQLAGYVANDRTKDLLTEIASFDPSWRARVAALDGIFRLEPTESIPFLERMARGENEFVSSFSEAALNAAGGRGENFADMRKRIGLGLRQEISTFARKSLEETIA